MRHAVLMLLYNTTDEQLELSKLALASVLAQDIGPLDVFVINNGSTQPTLDWLHGLSHGQGSSWLYVKHYAQNISPVKLANDCLKVIFVSGPHVLCVPNDVILPTNAYSEMVKWPRGFVSATPIEDCPQFQPVFTEAQAVSENTPMCCMLTRRWAHDALVAKDGYFFDARFEHYCSDCDLALRMAACGIRGVQLDIPVWHYRSASHRLAAEGVGKTITDRADVDRATFERKWGFKVSDPQYSESARDLNFRATGKD